MRHSLKVTAEVVGLHHWPDAPERRAYLRGLHRHRFIVTATVRVGHAEREIEFHDLSDTLEVYLRELTEPYHAETSLVTFGPRSCETMARHVGERLVADGVAVLSVEVSEDGEHSGTWVPDSGG